MPLDDNYGVTIYKTSGGTTATRFSNKESVEILDRNFLKWLLQISKQSLRLYIKTTVQLVTGVDNLCHRSSH